MSLLREDMREEFHLRRYKGQKNNGREEEYGDAEPFPCRWEPGARQVRNAEGKQVVAEGTLYTTARFSLRDLLWLPGTDPDDYKASRKGLNLFERKDLETGGFDHAEAVL